MPEFNDRRVKPRVHPDNSLVGDPHYFDPRTVAWVERTPPTIYRTGGHQRPRWSVQHLRANDQGGSMHTASVDMPTRKAALGALEQMKADAGTHVTDFTRKGNVNLQAQEFRKKYFPN